MASEFIGYTILVTLNNPPNAQIQGIVSNVVDQKLHLQNVLLLWNGQRIPSYILDASAIADVEVAPSQPSTSTLPTPTPATQQTQQMPANHGTSKPQPQQAFVDPAIVSYHKPIQPVIHPVSPVMIADGIVPSPVSPHSRSVAKQSSVSSIATTQAARRPPRRDSEATAILTEPFDAMALSNVAQAKKKHKSTPSQTAPGIIDMKDIQGPLKTVNTNKGQKAAGKGKGWRNTPLLDERSPRRQRGRDRKTEDANGWATEDATDIQDMGDFDFAGNLSKFNKRQVFDDIRKDDTVPEDERLVTFNRLAKPGTNGGRNLHFTENVLDNDRNDLWKSEAGETEQEEEVDGAHYSSGKGSRRANSRRPLASRKGSVIPGHVANERTASPRPLQRVATSPALNGRAGSVSGIKASLRLPNNKPCHCVSPLQMLEIEQLCTSDLGLSEDMLSENAGRSIAEAVLKTSSPTSTSDTPAVKTVVFLIGNHKSGARSVVAARHLRNRRLRVTVVLLGGEREETILESVKRQLAVYRKGGGWVERWDEYQAKLAQGAPRPDVIVDALLGVHVSFDELRTDDQAVVFEMTRWAGRSTHNNNGNTAGNGTASGTTTLLSIDVPSGVSATSGLITEAEGQLLYMRSTRVVALGAPKIGLLLAMSNMGLDAGGVDAVFPDCQWDVWVADVGISTVAWQRHGSRRRQGVEFSGEWVLPVKFVAG